MKAQPLIVVLSVLSLPPETRSEYLLQSESVCVYSDATLTSNFLQYGWLQKIIAMN